MLSCEKPILRVLVVDDHELTRFSLKVALAAQRTIEVVGLAGNGKEAIKMVERHLPDVVILDLQMPVMDGLTASIHLKRLKPDIQIIAYSSVEGLQSEPIPLTANIDAFCKKEATTQELIDLIKQLGNHKTDSWDGKANQHYTEE